MISYNMHGFNQGQTLLSYFCSDSILNCDVILVQEHWLTPANLAKLINFSESHTFFGKSAMEDAITKSVLIGRPWGGVGVFIKSTLIDEVKFNKCSERLVVVVYTTL